MFPSMKVRLIEEQIRPRQLGFTQTRAGSPSGWLWRWHRCKFRHAKFLRLEDVDPDRGRDLEFPMATYVELWRCRCGAEGINRVRALI